MTLKESLSYISKSCTFSTVIGGQAVRLKGTCEDVKQAYGRERFLVKLEGQDVTVWVENLTWKE